MRKIFTVLLLSLALTAGCKKGTTSGPTAPPLSGACNTADSIMYQTLVFSQGSILNLKATLANPQTAPATVSQLTPYYNQAKADYNIAEGAWQAYHAACVTNAAASSATAQAAVNKLSSDLQATPKVTQ